MTVGDDRCVVGQQVHEVHTETRFVKEPVGVVGLRKCGNVVGFEARQDIQATLIARIPSEMATLLE